MLAFSDTPEKEFIFVNATLTNRDVDDKSPGSPRACLKNKSYTKHKSYYCLLILKISKINIIYIIIDIF